MRLTVLLWLALVAACHAPARRPDPRMIRTVIGCSFDRSRLACRVGSHGGEFRLGWQFDLVDRRGFVGRAVVARIRHRGSARDVVLLVDRRIPDDRFPEEGLVTAFGPVTGDFVHAADLIPSPSHGAVFEPVRDQEAPWKIWYAVDLDGDGIADLEFLVCTGPDAPKRSTLLQVRIAGRWVEIPQP
jgi:hypothetical protein